MPKKQNGMLLKGTLLVTWFAAVVVAFLPFALNTSPLDAVLLHVPGNQGNWWHLLAGAPFFLAFPMILILARSSSGERHAAVVLYRVVWVLVGLSLVGSILVEVPFLLHLAGTSQWQRLLVLSVGFSVIVASAIVLLVKRQPLLTAEASMLGVNAAWLANASLCLVVYAGEPGTVRSRSGWFVAMVIVWPILVHLLWLFRRRFQSYSS
jgi:hypothetical protein